MFQEYKKALEMLQDAYFRNTSDGDEIIRQNINVMSDMYFGDSILQALVHQTKANNKDSDTRKRKLTYLFR